MPLQFSSMAMDASVSAPVARMAWTTGIKAGCKFVRRASQRRSTKQAGMIKVVRVTKPRASGLLGSERTPHALGYEPTLLFSQGGIKVEHERIGIPA
jgi:hypothetical protein